jgi:hypothetical protein
MEGADQRFKTNGGMRAFMRPRLSEAVKSFMAGFMPRTVRDDAALFRMRSYRHVAFQDIRRPLSGRPEPVACQTVMDCFDAHSTANQRRR